MLKVLRRMGTDDGILESEQAEIIEASQRPKHTQAQKRRLRQIYDNVYHLLEKPPVKITRPDIKRPRVRGDEDDFNLTP